MNKLILLLVSLTSLVAAQQQQINPRDLITPIAALQPRATGDSNTYYHGDCAASESQWLSCFNKGMKSDLCGLDLTNTNLQNYDTSCACDMATSMYNCYTSYCTTGTDYGAYYTGVSACAAGGMGSPPPAPTGAATTVAPGGSGGGGNGKPNSGSSVNGERAIWTLWIGLVFGTFVAMVL